MVHLLLEFFTRDSLMSLYFQSSQIILLGILFKQISLFPTDWWKEMATSQPCVQTDLLITLSWESILFTKEGHY